MHISRSVSEIKIDKNIGKELCKIIENANKRVIVISPWISKRYLDVLRNLTSKNVDVRIITSENEENYFALERFVIKKLLVKEFLFNFLLFLSSLMLFFYLMLLFLSKNSFILIIISTLVFISSILFLINLKESFKVRSDLNIKIQSLNDKNFLHLKAYLIDDVLFISSANLTEGGMRYNIESMVKFEEKGVIEEFLRFVDVLEHRLEFISLENFIKKYSLKSKFFFLIKK